jgi:hypothetical protein
MAVNARIVDGLYQIVGGRLFGSIVCEYDDVRFRPPRRVVQLFMLLGTIECCVKPRGGIYDERYPESAG